MKNFCIFVLLCVVASSVTGSDKYTTKYDNIDLDEILNNDRLLKNYLDCIMDRGRCTPDSQELRSSIAEGLETGCDKCSDKQKDGAKKVIRFLYEKKRDYFNELKEKYDPEGKYIEKYREEAKKEGVDI